MKSFNIVKKEVKDGYSFFLSKDGESFDVWAKNKFELDYFVIIDASQRCVSIGKIELIELASVQVGDTVFECKEVDIPTKNLHDLNKYTYDGSVFLTCSDGAIEKQSELIAEADIAIQPLMGYALAGIMSDAEKEAFKAWNEYRKALEDVDVTATDIEWPDKPE